jgi:hypothetical protein
MKLGSVSWEDVGEVNWKLEISLGTNLGKKINVVLFFFVSTYVFF